MEWTPGATEADRTMLFMEIETFRDNDMVPVYQRLQKQGRMLPDGLIFRDSWVEPNFGRCFQLMQCDDLTKLQEWILEWRGTGVTFEVVPVVPGKHAGDVITRFTNTKSED